MPEKDFSFVSILVCEKCGAVMKRNGPAKNPHTSPWYRCPTRGCDCKRVKCDLIVMEKITIYRTPEGELRLHIYPKLPAYK